MSIPIEAITDISRAVIAEQNAAVEVIVASNQGDSDRVELLLTLTGCHTEPCRVVLNLERSDKASFEAALRAKLRAVLASHL